MIRMDERFRKLSSDCCVKGIKFMAGTQLVFGFSNELLLCNLPEIQMISGIPCAKGWVHFHPNTTLAQCTLADWHRERGVDFPPGTTLNWNEDGSLIAKTHTRQLINGRSYPEGASLRFSDAGELIHWSRRLLQAEKCGPWLAEGGTMLTYFGNGQPKRLTLAETGSIEGIHCMAKTDIELHQNGHLAVCTLASDSLIQEVVFSPGTEIVFRADGSLASARLVSDTEVRGQRYVDGTCLYFSESGQLYDSVPLMCIIRQPVET